MAEPPGLEQDNEAQPRQVASAQASSQPVTSGDGQARDETVKNFQIGDRGYFTSLRWAADGTSLVLPTSTRHIHSYVLPPDLIDHSDGIESLIPYSTHILPEPAYALTTHPSWDLNATESCLFLLSPRNLPLRLYSPFAQSIVASYPWIKPTTEAFITPHSLLFSPHDPGVLFAGADNGQLGIFDLSRPGDGPLETLFLGRKKPRSRAQSTPSVDYSAAQGSRLGGIISALAMSRSAHGVVAAGTFAGQIGLVDAREGGSVSRLLPADADGDSTGKGVTSLLFHPDPSRDHYLLSASRLSDAILVFDVRQTGVMAVLEGRDAMTQQRMGFDITDDGDVWAGGTDGCVRMWKDVGLQGGRVRPYKTWKALHEDTVSGVGWHPRGAEVMATCAGSRVWDGEEDEKDENDASLKVWAFEK